MIFGLKAYSAVVLVVRWLTTSCVCWRWTRRSRTCWSSRSWMKPGWKWDHKSRITWRAVWRFSCCRSDSPAAVSLLEGWVCNDAFGAENPFFFFRVCVCDRICWGGQRSQYWSTCVWRTRPGRPHGLLAFCPHPPQASQGSRERHLLGWTSTTTSTTPSPFLHKSLRFSFFDILIFSSCNSQKF